MKYWYFLVLIFIIGVTSCEDVIEIDVPTGKPRLIVDALIRIDTTQEWLGVKVKVRNRGQLDLEIQIALLDNL